MRTHVTGGLLAAAPGVGTMLALFTVALLIVGPFAVITVARIRRDQRARRASAVPQPAEGEGRDPGQAPPADQLADVVAALEAAGRSDHDREVEVTVPARPRLGSRPADPAVVRTILDDAISRSGVVVLGRESAADGSEIIRCRARRTDRTA